MEYWVRQPLGLKSRLRSRFIPNLVPVQKGKYEYRSLHVTGNRTYGVAVLTTTGQHPSPSTMIPQDTEQDPQPPQETPTPQQSTHQGPMNDSGVLPSYFDGVLSFFTGEYDPEDMSQDDVLTEHLDDKIPAAARKYPIAVRQRIRRAYRNLGQPHRPSLVRPMRTASCQQPTLESARHRQCPTCLRRTPPQHVLCASMFYRPTRFNHVVCMDLIWLKDTHGVK